MLGLVTVAGERAVAAFGAAQREPASVTMRRGTWFDLASLTKVLFTTPTILRLAAEGRIGLDDALTGLDRDGDGRAWVHLTGGPGAGSGPAARVSLWAGEGYRWLQVFTGDPLGPDRRRKALAVEPMTCPPNAFATGQDLLVLQPGETVTHAWGIQASS